MDNQIEELRKAIVAAGFKISMINEASLLDVTTASYGYRTLYPQIEVRVYRKGQEQGIRQDIPARPAPAKGVCKRVASWFR